MNQKNNFPPKIIRHYSEVENKVKEIISRMKSSGKIVATKVEDSPGLPCNNYTQLQDELTSRKYILWSLNRYNSSLFFLLAPPFETYLTYINSLCQFLIPILSLVFAFVFSWWCLLGLFLFPFTLKFGKRNYATIILRSAAYSELLFCFLYNSGEIALTTPELNKFWDIYKS